MAITIREATVADVKGFDLWDEENQGDTVEVAEMNGEIVGFVQRTGTTIYMLESKVCGQGVAKALVEYVLDGEDFAIADNVGAGCRAFWAKMGFRPDAAYGADAWTWEPAE